MKIDFELNLFSISCYVFLCALITACGGSSNSEPNSPQAIELFINIGDTQAGIAWSHGTSNSTYTVDVVESLSQTSEGNIQISDNRALISELRNNISYTVTVSDTDSSASSTITFTPSATNPSEYRELTIQNEPGSLSGYYDPSLLRASNTDIYLSYSAVDFYNNTNSELVQDVGIRLAKSSDNGLSFNYLTTIASPSDGTATQALLSPLVCGTTTCNGRWVYEVSWMIEDINDPNPDRRFKLFAHRYFLYPPAVAPASPTVYPLGAIVMWTASSPEATWSSEETFLRWPLTPTELLGTSGAEHDITSIANELSNCTILSEGGGRASSNRQSNEIDLVFSCPFKNGANEDVQKIVLLRSNDHLQSLSYIDTLLDEADAMAGTQYFSAPSIIANDDNAPLLLATPVANELYNGSLVYLFSNENNNLLFQNIASTPEQAQPLLFSPVSGPSSIGGASSYVRDAELGLLQSDALLNVGGLINTQFRILDTRSLTN